MYLFPYPLVLTAPNFPKHHNNPTIYSLYDGAWRVNPCRQAVHSILEKFQNFQLCTTPPNSSSMRFYAYSHRSSRELNNRLTNNQI